jgi:hypothetical protein
MLRRASGHLKGGEVRVIVRGIGFKQEVDCSGYKSRGGFCLTNLLTSREPPLRRVPRTL